MTTTAKRTESENSETETSKTQKGGGQKHALILGLIQELPPIDEDWPVEGRKKWLQTAAHIFDLIYPSTDDGQSLKIDIAKDASG